MEPRESLSLLEYSVLFKLDPRLFSSTYCIYKYGKLGKKIINLSPALLQNSEFIVYIQIIFAQLITYIINIIILYSTACERLKCGNIYTIREIQIL